ncbi:MAG: hypothetical protein PWP24_1021 [Clostridiales bacterium]|nr:hypothetical protein [Clostridiales bacterium]
MRDSLQVEKKKRDSSIDYFRSFLMLLVVWHHATLAYSTSGSGVLIADNATFVGFDLIALYNDVFFMFAFFFISGLFSYRALRKKGTLVYLEERLIRLLLPFGFGTLLLNPIAHYFSTIKGEGKSASFSGYGCYFVQNFGRIEANHLWFLWVLFLFSLVLILYAAVKQEGSRLFAGKVDGYLTKAAHFFLAMLVIGVLVFLPLRNVANGGFVTILKPFNMQLSRILLYLLFFIAGNIVGTFGIKKSFFYQDKFQKKWWIWCGLSLFLTACNVVIHVIQEGMGIGITKSIVLAVEQCMVVPISILALYGFLSFFMRYSKKENKWMDLLAKEAMGIYVIHYAVVTVLQYVFTFLLLPAVLKGILVMIITVLLSLAAVIFLKKIPLIGTVFGREYQASERKILTAVTILMLLALIIL